jgi:hypothetical protein
MNGIGFTIVNSTIAFNSAQEGGGISGSATIRNSIVAKNTAPSVPDLSNTVVSQGFNLIGASSGFNAVATDLVGVDPLLDDLKDNGGPTETLALLAGSPAIERGHSSGVARDQRGLLRPVDTPALANAAGGDGSDIGAYEVQANQLPGCSDDTIVTTNADSGPGSLRAKLASACSGQTITFAPDVTSPIALTSDQLLVERKVSIAGPGASTLTVQRSSAAGTPSFRVFEIAADADASIAGLTIANGSTDAGGGGLLVQSGAQLILREAAVTGNDANERGGGLYNSGTTHISRTSVSGNSGNLCGAGAHVSTGTLTVADSTFTQNTATFGGGGICVGSGGIALIANTTIAGNSANEGAGGGISNQGAASLRNSIVATNTALITGIADIGGPLTSQGFNLIGNDSGASITPAQSSDQIGTPAAPIDPLLGPLQCNGGPTRTMALLAGSPALDKGHSSGSSTDQRGLARPVDSPAIANAPGGDGADIGAFESNGALIDADGSGSHDALTDGLLVIRYLFGLSGNSLVAGAIGPTATRTGAQEIVAFLDANRQVLDVDGNGSADALTDGLILIRYLFGVRGTALTANAIGPNATRTPAEIEAYLLTLLF